MIGYGQSDSSTPFRNPPLLSTDRKRRECPTLHDQEDLLLSKPPLPGALNALLDRGKAALTPGHLPDEWLDLLAVEATNLLTDSSRPYTSLVVVVTFLHGSVPSHVPT